MKFEVSVLEPKQELKIKKTTRLKNTENIEIKLKNHLKCKICEHI